MNILIVSCEAWRDTNNGGNVLSNVFCAFPDAHIAQIYCSGELPQNSVCQKYFQISDSMLLTSEKGRKLEVKDYSVDDYNASKNIENKIKNKTPKLFRESLLLFRECLWGITKWKTKELEKFIIEFQPDVIFAPCYSYFHVSKLALHVKKIASCPMISYISDDNYSLKRISLSLSFWINRFITRKWIRNHFSECSLVYTMTEQQKIEYEALLKCPMKVLCKSAIFEEQKREIGNPIRLIYAGGLYLNRWKVLGELSNILNKINKDRVIAQLHIYSNTKLNPRKTKLLNDKRSSFLHSAIPYNELVKKYQQSDIAVHVESFDLRNRLITRLSFSTKIIDCMNSGCAILAIGPKTQAGMTYLKDNNAAVCVNELSSLRSKVSNLLFHPETIFYYSKQAQKLGEKNHKINNINAMIRNDFSRIVKK